MAVTLEQLVAVRSQRASKLLASLREIADHLDATPWVRRDGRRILASEIAVEPFVLTAEKRRATSHDARDEEDRRGAVEPRSPWEEIDAARYELPIAGEDREEVRWRQVVRRGRVRLGLKGAPGGGKTFITRHTVAEALRGAADRLERQEVDLNELDAGLCVTASALAQVTAEDVAEALLQAAERTLELTLSGVVREWWRQAFGSARALVVVDALDELHGAPAQEAFERRARQLDALPGPVLVTCRTMHWDQRRAWLHWSRTVEVELAPLKRRQQREIVAKFFADAPDLAQTLQRLLQTNFALRHACTTPLLLTFACLLHDEELVKEATTRAELYAHMLRRMLSGRWRGVKPSWADDEILEESCVLFLEGIGWHLFREAPELNRFTLPAWRRAAAIARAEDKIERPMAPDRFLRELQRVGLVAPAGFEGRDRSWSFAHRTFLEYLAASHLSRKPEEVWLAEAKQHFWFQPEWLEVLTFLAGIVDDATPLMDAVEQERKNDDVFGTMLALKARLLGATGRVGDEFVRRGCTEVLSFWRSTLAARREWQRQFALPVVPRLAANAMATGLLLEGLLELSRNEDPAARYAVAESLSTIGGERAVTRLLELSHDPATDVAFAAVRALGISGDERAVARLLILTCDNDGYAGYIAREALGSIGGDGAVDALLRLTYDAVESVRNRAMYALGIIGGERAVARLFELIQGDDPHLGAAAARGLGETGDRGATPRLIDLTRHQLAGVRYEAVRALGKIADERALETLVSMTGDEHLGLRFELARALGRIGGRRAVEGLLELTRLGDETVGQAAAEELGGIGDERAVERLWELIRVGHPYVGRAAAGALQTFGSEWVAQRVLELTRDTKRTVRYLALVALARTSAEGVLQTLLELTGDEHPPVRYAAVLALVGITEREIIEVLHGRPIKLPSLSGTRLQCLNRAAGKFLELARDADKRVCMGAAVALGLIGAEQAVPTLLELTWDANLALCLPAVRLLGSLASGQAVRRLGELTSDGDERVRRAAARALWQVAWKNRMPIRLPAWAAWRG